MKVKHLRKFLEGFDDETLVEVFDGKRYRQIDYAHYYDNTFEIDLILCELFLADKKCESYREIPQDES